MLYLVVFLSGASVMVLELAGSRILAPFLGTSVYIWTALIGVILAALSVGYAWGGRLADRNPSVGRLARLLLLASVATALIVPLQYPVLVSLGRSSLDLRLAAVIATVTLFLVPALVMGAVTPLALRLSLSDVTRSGEVAGRLYALSTLGSIVGTFLAGFVLFAMLGSNLIVLTVAGTLLLCSILIAPKERWLLKVVAAAFLLLLALGNARWRSELDKQGSRDVDTAYQRVTIVDDRAEADGKTIRRLITDPLGAQSEMVVGDPANLITHYLKHFDLAFAYKSGMKTALMLGGAAYSYPKYFVDRYDQVTMDVVEIDPGITAVAERWFELKPHPKLTIIHEDGRVYLNRNTRRYDAILTDAFNAPPSIPFQLTSREAIERMHASLVDDGVLLMNIVTGITGERGRFLRAEIKTVKSLFPEVHLYQAVPGTPHHEPQNVVLVATKIRKEDSPRSTDPNITELLTHEVDISGLSLSDAPVLTDQFAPVEDLLLPTAERMEELRQGA